MKLGFVSAILPDLSLEEVVKTAAELGYDAVELMCWPVGKAERRYAGVTHVDVSELTPTRAEEILSVCAAHGVEISGLGYYPNLLAADPGEAQIALSHLVKVIEAAPRLRVGVVNTFIGRNPSLSVDDNWSKMLEVWRPIVALASGLGIKVGIENCPMYFTSDEWPGGKNLAVSPKIWQRLFEDLPSENLGLNYDPSHLVWQMMDPIAPLREFAHKLVHVHAKDARVDKHKLDKVGVLAHPLEYHSPKLPGLGDVDWGRFFSVLGDTGYDGCVCVEVEDRVYEGSLEGRRRALRQSADFLTPLIGKQP